MQANTPLGRLPTLGLNQIKLEDFVENGQDDNNMFRLHKKTEHLLVARELEREFKDLNKFDKTSLRVWEKGTSTRVDRPGTIRVVNEIPALKPIELQQSRNQQKKKSQSMGGAAGSKTSRNKLMNIFDSNDSHVAKNNRSLVPIESQ